MAEADKVAAGALQQAIGVLRNILSSPERVTSLASSLERPTGSSARNTTHSTLESEMRALFRPGCSQVDASAGQTATQGQSGGFQRIAIFAISDSEKLWQLELPSKEKVKTTYIYNLTVPNDVKRKFASQNNIFMEHDLNILMIFGITEKFIILTDTMYFWLRDYVTRHVHKLVKCNVRLLILQHVFKNHIRNKNSKKLFE